MNISILTTDIRSEHDVMLTRQRTRQIARLLGFESQDQTRLATGVSEIARNAVQHAGGGKVEFQLTDSAPQLLQILIKDNGPSIPDLASILTSRDPASSKPGDSLRGVRRLMDVFEVHTSSGKGTQITLGKYRSRLLPAIERKEMERITVELMQRVSEDPLIEMQRQNQELLRTLEEVRVQQEERDEHLKKIETLNSRLQRSMRATHHRVKNNLQIISALVELQTDATDNMVPLEALLRIGRHSRALAALHDLLTHADMETEVVSAKPALEKLLPLLQATAGGRCIHFAVEDFILSVEESASLALLISELISNALKHGQNDVELVLTVSGNTASLEVCNDGAGFPPDFDWRKDANTGLGIIDSTGRHDLKGNISYENRSEGGARVRVTFPICVAEPH